MSECPVRHPRRGCVVSLAQQSPDSERLVRTSEVVSHKISHASNGGSVLGSDPGAHRDASYLGSAVFTRRHMGIAIPSEVR